MLHTFYSFSSWIACRSLMNHEIYIRNTTMNEYWWVTGYLLKLNRIEFITFRNVPKLSWNRLYSTEGVFLLRWQEACVKERWVCLWYTLIVWVYVGRPWKDKGANTSNETEFEATSSSSTTHNDSSQGAPPQFRDFKS